MLNDQAGARQNYLDQLRQRAARHQAEAHTRANMTHMLSQANAVGGAAHRAQAPAPMPLLPSAHARSALDGGTNFESQSSMAAHAAANQMAQQMAAAHAAQMPAESPMAAPAAPTAPAPSFPGMPAGVHGDLAGGEQPRGFLQGFMPRLPGHAVENASHGMHQPGFMPGHLIHLGQGLFLHPITGEIHGFGPQAPVGGPMSLIHPGPVNY